MSMTLMLAATLLAAAVTPALAPFQWEERVLVIFANEDDPLLADQATRLDAARDGLEEREMAVFSISQDDRLTPLFGAAPGEADIAAIRQQFGIERGAPFTMLLIGKDGTEKWRSDTPTDMSGLFAMIDAMPMRRAEMKETSTD